MLNWLSSALDLFNLSNHRIVWNLFLAFIPLLCSWFLFRPSINPSIIWWAFFCVFIAFLPNAPYILTDTIHLIEISQQGYALSLIILVLIPQYSLFVLAGFGAYAISPSARHCVIALMRLDSYLIERGQAKYVISVNLIIHALCAVGIYLGRFERFNSWDLLTQPTMIVSRISKHLLNKYYLLGILTTFTILSLLYWFLKFVKRQILTKISFDVSQI
ncbi:protein of unknown function DUF1361 [Stanieria cyanosphaera PCC 7437]|uniref:DUF1361 domain-containing protein n=1 Tax=Stanieria cyanosphaera (strain ATCC 29371 / PCC 7437) TaxID=111780 RepID=K9XQ50_STAC7|nr:DUF1361 domain-containing protein [Stanieria cyanosphaera]AFZ34171.1 protein of unknown function DUF1361 [Stanieria cyanosphaera PCC 7437]